MSTQKDESQEKHDTAAQKAFATQLQQCMTQFNELLQEMLQKSLQGAAATSSTIPSDNYYTRLQNTRIDFNEVTNANVKFMEQQTQLWLSAGNALFGAAGDTEQAKGEKQSSKKTDSRFAHQDWQTEPMFKLLKDAWFIQSQWLDKVLNSCQFEDPKLAQEVAFYARQYINSVAPTNFAATNPEVIEETINSKGANILKGARQFLDDLERSLKSETIHVAQTDIDAFEPGENLATTPGVVVYQNELIQLIQYRPSTEQVFNIPILIVPPFINKFYILDLDENKSLIRWLVQQGYTVFVISWVNPDASLAERGFEDFMLQGPLAAMDVVKATCNVKKVHMTGWCIGGTLLGATAAWLKAKRNHSIQSLTFLTTLFDFSEPGGLGNYFSDTMLPLVKAQVDKKGYLDGRMLGLGFSLLRENNLFWSFYINNYLKGKDPAPFDMLYWNSDSTNLTRQCFYDYIENTYQKNCLKDGEMELAGVRIDLSKINQPTYVLATLSDHIVLWQSAYQSARLLSGDTRFVLAGSGHLAGVINPVEKGKYPHWINGDLPESEETWLSEAQKKAGSWWPDWQQWLAPKSGDKTAARQPGMDPNYPPIECAPGSYVKKRLA